MNRFHGIHQDGRFSRVQQYCSDGSSSGDEDEYEGDADDDSFASAQYSTGHSIAHSDIPDFSSVCSSLNSVLGGNASFSKHSYSSKSRKRFSKLPSTLRHIESQASLAYSLESSPSRVSPLPMEEEVTSKNSAIPTKVFSTESPESYKNESRPDDRAKEKSFSLHPPPPPSPPKSSHYLPQPVDDDDDDMGISLSPYPDKNISSPPVTKKFLDLQYSEVNMNPFSPIKLEPHEDNTRSPSVARPSAIYTLRSSSTDTSPTCSTFSTGYTSMPSHVRSERLEKIKMKLRAIEGHVRPRLERRNSSIVAPYSYSTSPSSSQSTSVRDVQSTSSMGGRIKTILSEQGYPSPAIRIARETMSFCFLVYIVSVAYLMHRDSQVNNLQLQISQMQLVEQKLMLSLEAESRSMQLQIEKYKFMGHTLAIAQKSKQLEEFSSTPNPSVEFRPIKNLFDLRAPTPTPSNISEEQPQEGRNLPVYVDSMRAPTPTPTPSFSRVQAEKENRAPTLISHQEPKNALSQRTVKRYSIPMHDFFIVQSMLD